MHFQSLPLNAASEMRTSGTAFTHANSSMLDPLKPDIVDYDMYKANLSTISFRSVLVTGLIPGKNS